MSLPSVACLYLTEDSIRELKSGTTSFRVSIKGSVIRYLYELCWAVVRGVIPLQKCKTALESVELPEKISSEVMGSNLADVVAQMAQDVTIPTENRCRLIKLAKWLVDSSLVPLRLFYERCEEDFLFDSEMIKIKAQDLKSKEVRVNTRLLYQQTKFNLLREESEGYAKLVTLLCYGSVHSSRSASSLTIGLIKSLIGHFDLDPNRVFDIVLECFELQPDNDIFLDLIPIFPKSHASQILGLKFQFYQRVEINSRVPFGLYRLTALLVREGFIDFDSIYVHLLPKADEAFEHYGVFLSKRMDEANKIGRINLAATGKDLMDDEKQGDVTIDLYGALDMETGASAQLFSDVETSQPLGLLSGFLHVEDWPHASLLLNRLSPLNPVAHLQICDGLFRLIENSISAAYEVVREMRCRDVPLIEPSLGSLDLKEVNAYAHESFVDLPKIFFEMLSSVGPYFYRNAVLLQKVCRVLRAYYLSALGLLQSESANLASETVVSANCSPRSRLKEARGRIEDALGACLLPALQLIPATPAVGQEIWEVMNLLPYEVRYRLYGEWEKDDERIPILMAARQTAKLDTRRILKRLAKENLKQLGRMIAKLAHANPMTVLRTIVHQIEAYRDMISPVVDAFKYLTQLEYDILEYVVIERLAQGGREKLKDDGLNLSDWLQSLASFWGHLCKKYPSMELKGLFQYLVNQLKRGSGVELVVLQELIQQMANVQYTENMTEEQLDAMAGSETLRYQATSFGISRNNKALSKSTSRLKDALLPNEEPKLAIPLLLLVAQHRSVVVINADATYIKMVSEQFDRCHGTLLQFVEFLSNAITPCTAYAQLVPPLEVLVHQYHLDPEVAFLIYRPVMRLFRFDGCVESSWPLDDDEFSLSSSAAANESDIRPPGSFVLDLGPPRKIINWSDLLETVRSMLPPKAWNSLSPELYTTFWGLSLYDLHVPNSRYDSEIGKLHAALRGLEEISDNSSSAISKRKKEKERIQDSLDRLSSELLKHEERVSSVRKRLCKEKDRWLSSCPDTLKINLEFLQRCVFPRCTFSMPDAVYCAVFVQTLHSLQTPFFNTVNHIDVLICKTLQPMICCCTEYEAGRLGRFLYETLKMAYYWKSDEAVYERECGNMPGFAVYYRFPNSQRVTYSQFIKVHWKWSQRITRLLIQCLESSEYMEIRNSLIMLTKISSIFPVTRKSGINLEKRVAKIKSDEREDLKVLGTGVAAALAARKPSWVTEEEFGMGYLELKQPLQNSKAASVPPGQSETGAGKPAVASGASNQEPVLLKGKTDKAETLPPLNSKNAQTEGQMEGQRIIVVEDGIHLRSPADPDSKTAASKRPQAVSKPPKDDAKSGKVAARPSAEPKMETAPNVSSGPAKGNGTAKTANGDDARRMLSVLSPSEKLQRRSSPSEDPERSNKRRRAESEARDADSDRHDLVDHRPARPHGDDDKPRDRPFGREGSAERPKDEKPKARHFETTSSHGHSLPPPPPLPHNVVPHSLSGRRDEDGERRVGVARHSQRLSPRLEEALFDDAKRRRDEPDTLSAKVRAVMEQVEEREKSNVVKDEIEAAAASKRRKLKREHVQQQQQVMEAGEYTPGMHGLGLSHSYDARDRAERKGGGSMVQQRVSYTDDPATRFHPKEAPSKFSRHDPEPSYDRDWEEDKRQRVDLKRRHRK